MAEGKRGYVTFLAGNKDYVKGVVGLAKGLRKVKSAYCELMVAVLPDVPEEHREILKSQGCAVREIDAVYPPPYQVQFAMAYYVISYSKLRMWNFDDYSRMIYLDADTQVYDNIDHLFDLPEGYFYAVKDCFCEQTWSHSRQYSIGYCQQCPHKVTWPPEMGSPPPLYFNAGMFLFEPSRLTCQSLLDCLKITPPTPFAEQFDDYSRMIYLDADTQVYDNIDHLFDLPEGYFYAVKDCFCEQTWSHSRQYSIGYCQQCPHKVTWPPEMGSPPPLYFNAGMFLFEPSRLTCQSLLDCLKITPPTPFAEQDFLNMFFEKIYKPIPLIYNLVLAILWRHPENVELDKVKVVHYCAAGSKPWRYTGNEPNMGREDVKMLVAKWWDIYNDDSLDFKK